jgi:hypothetical protein
MERIPKPTSVPAFPDPVEEYTTGLLQNTIAAYLLRNFVRSGDDIVFQALKRDAVCTENSVRVDYVSESPNVSSDDRPVLPLPGPVRLAVQVEEPTRGRERCAPTSADHIAAEGAWPRPAHE